MLRDNDKSYKYKSYEKLLKYRYDNNFKMH